MRDNVSQNCESSQSTIHSDLPYIRRSTRVRNPPNRYGDWVVGEHEAQVWYVYGGECHKSDSAVFLWLTCTWSIVDHYRVD